MTFQSNFIARSSDDPYFWYLFGIAPIEFTWSTVFGGGNPFDSHWLTVKQFPWVEPERMPHIDLGSHVTSPIGEYRDEDRVTFDLSGTYSVIMNEVEYVDSTLDTVTHLNHFGHFGFTSDGSFDSLTAAVGNHSMDFTTAIKNSSLNLGSGWDIVTLEDHRDLPGTQYWSLIRRDNNEIDAYSLITGNRIRMEGGAESLIDTVGKRNYGEIEQIIAQVSDPNDPLYPTVVFNPGGGDLPNPGDRGIASNIDLRSDGATHTDSFNLAYFNFIRYTSDNVWVGEATIHNGTIYSTPSDRTVDADKNVYLKSGYNYDAPVLAGQLSVIGQSRNGTHDLIVAEQATAINGNFRLYTFDVGSGLYNEFNQVFLGTAVGENPTNFGSATTDTPANRVAMYGFGGNDILTGGAGKDYLFGGSSTFNVTNANNTAIVSDSGNVITGGTGADYFGTGATNSFGQLINGAGSILGTGLETGAPQGSFVGSASTGGLDGQGVGLFWVSHATDVITDWQAGIDTLVVLENGVAIIGGVRSGATVTDLRGSNTSVADGDTTINLRATAAVATSDQDFDGARGGSDSQLQPSNPDFDAADAVRNWDQAKSIDFVYDNQGVRDVNSITNEANDVTVVNAGLIVARGLGGNDILLDSPGDDYLYGNRGSNTISLAAGGNDRVYYDTFDGAQARHYVSGFTKSAGATTDRDTFYLNKGVIDAFYSAGNTRALTTADVNGIYTDAIAYSPSINFLHDVFYNPSIVTTNAVHRGEDGQAPSVLSGSDGTTFGIGVGMFAAGTVLLFVPFMAGVGYALIGSGTALGAGSALLNTQPHQNATFAGNVGAYLNVLTEQPNANGEGTLLKPNTSVSSVDAGVTFLSFFEGVNAGDGYLPVVEFTSHAGQGIFGYFALHSSTETFVYLVASRDNLVTESEAIQIAQIEGNLTAADFAIYDGRVDIYNQAVEAPIVIVDPTIVTLGDDTIADVLTLNPKRFDDVDNPLKLTMTVPGDVVGARIKIYDGTNIVFDGTSGSYTSAAFGNNPGGVVSMSSSTYNSGTGVTTFVFSDTRAIGTRAIQTDNNALNDPVNGNQFQLTDGMVNYTIAFVDPTTAIETYAGTGGVEVAGGNATIDGQAGDDILFVTETSLFLNGASNGQIVSIENIVVSGASGILLDLRNQNDGFIVTASTNVDTIFGSSGNDTIFTAGANTQIDLNAGGADVVVVSYDNGGLGADTGFATISGSTFKIDVSDAQFNVDHDSDATTATVNLPGWIDRDGDSTRLMYETATLGAEMVVASGTELLVVSNSNVSSAGDLTANIAAALDSAFNLAGLDGRAPSASTGASGATDSSVLFAVQSNTAGYFWVGRYQDTGNDDTISNATEIEVFAHVQSSNVLENFWLDTELAPQKLGLTLPADTGPTESGTYVTNNTSFSVSGLQSGNSVYYSLDGGGNWTTAPVNQTTITLAQGSHDIQVRQRDGNNFSPESEITTGGRTVVVDTTIPEISGLAKSGSTKGYDTFQAGLGDITLSWAISEANPHGTTVEYKLSSASSYAAASGVSDAAGNHSVNVNDLATGTYNWRVTHTDDAGNSTTINGPNFTLDPPVPPDTSAPYLELSKSTLPGPEVPESNSSAPQVNLIVDFSGIGILYRYDFDDLLADGTVDVSPTITTFGISVEGRSGPSTSGAAFSLTKAASDILELYVANPGSDLGPGWEDKVTITATVNDAVGNTLNFTDIIYWDY